MIKRRAVINYLSNTELLKEIHKSKTSYCEFIEPKFSQYHLIIEKDISKLTQKDLQKAAQELIRQENEKIADLMFEQGSTNKEMNEFIDKNTRKVKDIKKSELVIRVMCDTHIPETLKVYSGKKDKMMKQVNFPPFVHVAWIGSKWKIVGRSNFKNGQYALDNGRLTEKLGKAIMLLTKKYGKKGNWNGYSYNDEMQATAMARLCQTILSFNEGKSDNPFAYMTQIVSHAFILELKSQKNQANIKADLYEMYQPDLYQTASRQADQDIENWHRSNNPLKLVVTNDE